MNKHLENKFRRGTIMRAIVKLASFKAISRDILVPLIARKMRTSQITVQSEISNLLDPANRCNNNRVKMDGRATNGKVRLIAA